MMNSYQAEVARKLWVFMADIAIEAELRYRLVLWAKVEHIGYSLFNIDFGADGRQYAFTVDWLSSNDDVMVHVLESFRLDAFDRIQNWAAMRDRGMVNDG